ncbi:histidine phosphatase family protein [Aldersonia sp. NBC_00410]|uniref:histidine phosphatase family protein n=1 Tax=Aldersonia sp. NBC_00410 TaxID=2975954 RepID=UPI0022521605|nr:histidine phosphatase family protein [Aldersonia sp. NBC_00410]MCX5044493.1 histidine phosphatase family protein [Aldersonia sp. NBC_00410]
MATVVRLLLVSHASTEALRNARFPADEPLNETGRKAAAGAAWLSAHKLQVAPELRTRETASALGVEGHAEPELRDVDYGKWRGLSMDDVPVEQLSAWLSDPAARPHGGESIVELIARVAGWLTAVAAAETDTLAVTHPAVVRAALLVTLKAPAQSFWRIDIAPLTVTRLHCRGGVWTLRGTGHDSPRLTP